MAQDIRSSACAVGGCEENFHKILLLQRDIHPVKAQDGKICRPDMETDMTICLFGQSNRWGNEVGPWTCAIGLPHTPLSLGFYFMLPGWSGNLEAERLNHSGPSLLRCLVCSSSPWNSSLGDSSLIWSLLFIHRLNSIKYKCTTKKFKYIV